MSTKTPGPGQLGAGDEAGHRLHGLPARESLPPHERGEETGELRAGEIALVPAMAPHSLRNVGSTTARVLGFFSSSTNIATFTEPMGPGGPQVIAIGAPIPLAAPLGVPALA